MVWPGFWFVGNRVFGSYIFEGTIKSENYPKILGDSLMPDVDNSGSRRRCLIQDGTTPHNGNEVRYWLDENSGLAEGEQWNEFPDHRI